MKIRQSVLASWILVALGACPLVAQQEQEICPKMVTMLVTQLVFGTDVSDPRRVEMRQCGVGSFETLQLVAWPGREDLEPLVIDTTDFTVVQAAARANVFVVETTGGPRDRVYVISYDDDKPTLELFRVTRGTAEITITGNSIDLIITGIYAGDAPPRTERHQFTLRGPGAVP